MLRLCAPALTGRGGDKVNRSTVSLYGIYHVSAYNGLAALVNEIFDDPENFDIETFRTITEDFLRTLCSIC